MFTFSFSASFAATGDAANVVTALDREASILQSNLQKQGELYIASQTWDSDDEAVVSASASATVTMSKAVLTELVAKKVTEGQTKISELSRYLASAVTDSNAGSSTSAWTDLLASGISSGTTAGTWTSTVTMSGASAYSFAGYPFNEEALVNAQFDAEYKAVKTQMNAYLATLDNYSDDPNAWSVSKAETAYKGGDGEADSITYNLTANAGTAGYALTAYTGTGTVTAKDFVEDVANGGLTRADVLKAWAGTTVSNRKACIENPDGFVQILKIAKDIIEGQKKDTDHPYYIAGVPTLEEMKADTTLDAAKAKEIKQMKADLNAAAVYIENKLNAALAEENKKAKPAAATVNTLTKALADLDGQVAATEKVYTALINYCDTMADLNTEKAGGVNTFNEGLLKIKTPKDGPHAYGTTQFTDALTELAQNAEIVDNVDALEAEAALLGVQKDVNGQPLYEAGALKAALAEQTEKLYKNSTSLEDAKKALQQGSEVLLVIAKRNHVNYINGYATTSWVPEDKYGDAINDTNLASVKAWNKASATRSAGTVQITVTSPITVESGTVYVYDKAQKEVLKTLVAETEDAIKAAKTIDEVKTIFAAAQEKYEDIDTTADHATSWTTKKLATAYAKNDYATQLAKYADYLMTTVDPDTTAVNDANLEYVGISTLYEAYTVEELPAKFEEAKTAMAAALKTKDEMTEARKAVNAAIDALPTAKNVTLADKAAIEAAADMLDDYNDIPATKLVAESAYKLPAIAAAYEELAAKELDAAYKALQYKTITVADAEAIEALRDMYDAWADFVADYNNKVETSVLNPVNDTEIVALETKLSDAKVAAVREMMIKLPANPTAAQRAEVEAARAAYEALTLAEKAKVVDSPAYDNLIDAEEALDVLNVYAVKALKLKANSKATKGAITVKWTVTGDAAAADGYQVWKSTKMNKGYKKAFTTTKTTYKNTKGLKKGVKYYYKVRAYVVVDGKNVYSDWSNKAYRAAK